MQRFKINPRYRWFVLTALLTLVFSLVGLRSSGLANPAPAPASEPVWGRKPVLAYFFLTSSLAEILQKEVGIPEPQFREIQDLARQEAAQLEALEAASLEIVADNRLTLSQKRAQIASRGYNQQAAAIIVDSQQQLGALLDERTYDRLVAWIESRWLVERELHGSPQAAASPSGARTYSIYATRYDAGGAYAVALPDKCVKFANIGWHTCDEYGYQINQNYSVKLKYQNSVTAKVLESGPWNVDDAYWATTNDPTPRRMFTDLPLGMPEAQAAYFDNYNGGLDQFGRVVTAPFGIDLAREVSIDIGLQPGENDWIEVTFLWTENWDSAPAQVITLGKPTKLIPKWDGDTDHAAINWTCPVTTLTCDTSEARYTIAHAQGSTTVSRDQCPIANDWVNLGTYEFNQGTGGKVTLTDLNSEADFSRTVSFSAMRFSLLSAPTPTPRPTNTPTPTATPTQTPTPTATPFPAVGASLEQVQPGESVTVTIGASGLQAPGLGSALVEVQYDPAVVNAVGCNLNPGGYPTSQADCNLSSDQDGVYPDAVRFDLAFSPGVNGTLPLADIGFSAVGPAGGFSNIGVILLAFSDTIGTPITATAHTGWVCIQPCQGVYFMPLFTKFYVPGP